METSSETEFSPDSLNIGAGSTAVLSMAGISSNIQPDYELVGYTNKGIPVFSSSKLAKSRELRSGTIFLHTVAAKVFFFNVLKKADFEALEAVAKNSSSPTIIKDLDKKALEKSAKNFIGQFLSAAKTSSKSAIGVQTGLKVFSVWGLISPAQKSLLIALAGIQCHLTSEGGPVCDLKIIDSKDEIVTVREALAILEKKINAYSLLKNYKQFRFLYRIVNGKEANNVNALADFAVLHNVLGSGPKGAAIPLITEDKLAKAQGFPMPQYGVGAVGFNAPDIKSTPKGYVKSVKSPGGIIIVPQANASTSLGAVSQNSGSLLGTNSGTVGMSSGSVELYKKWNKEKYPKQNNGALGGSQFIGALKRLITEQGTLLGALVDHTLYETAENYEGSNERSEKGFRYVACVSLSALRIIVTGEVNSKINNEDEILNFLEVPSVISEANFAKLAVNLRGYYANQKVASKASAFQLSNQAYAEHRIDESTIISMQEVFNMVYEPNGFSIAKKILYGKVLGEKVSEDEEKDTITKNTMENAPLPADPKQKTERSKEDIRARNKAMFNNGNQPPGQPQQGQQPMQPPAQIQGQSPITPPPLQAMPQQPAPQDFSPDPNQTTF